MIFPSLRRMIIFFNFKLFGPFSEVGSTVLKKLNISEGGDKYFVSETNKLTVLLSYTNPKFHHSEWN
jgi:hypothetical protein